MKYYIYHVPGIKIGCCEDPHQRIKVEQGFEHWEILEDHFDIYEASKRERELQERYGYTVDSIPYFKMGILGKKGGKIGGKIGGPIVGRQNVERGIVSKAGKANTFETLSQAGKIGGAKNTEKQFGARSDVGKLQGIKNATEIKKCPHCQKEGTQVSLMRWHFNNCKQKNQNHV
jgi:hypothetical protein